MTKYIYKGKEISHISFIKLMSDAGIQSGWRMSHYEHLTKLAAKGNSKAQELLKNLEIKER